MISYNFKLQYQDFYAIETHNDQLQTIGLNLNRLLSSRDVKTNFVYKLYVDLVMMFVNSIYLVYFTISIYICFYCISIEIKRSIIYIYIFFFFLCI